jgi:hypothetical protein
VVVSPWVIVVLLGAIFVLGALHAGVTVTRAVVVFAVPQLFMTLAQYEVVVVGLTLTAALFPPGIGVDVSPAVPTYHCTASGGVPFAASWSVAVPPLTIDELLGSMRIAGGTQAGVTVTVAVQLYALPQLFVTSTQYAVVALGAMLSVVPVAPLAGFVMSGAVPVYHWYESGVVPMVETLSVVLFPCVIVVSTGSVVIVGASQDGSTATVAAALSMVLHAFVRAAQ